MFSQLKKRLILLYAVTSSIILTVIIIGISILNYKQNNDQEKVLFQKNSEQIVEKIRSDHIINNAWMLQMQSDNDYIIVVEENSKELSGYNKKDAVAEKELLVQDIKKQAVRDGIRLDRRPLYSRVEKTSVYTLDLEGRKSYLGMATLLPKGNGWMNIMIFSGNELRHSIQLGQLLIFVLIDLIGVTALSLMSTFYIRKVIRPLEEGQEKQNAFIAAASHELRSPMTVIKTGVAAIREDITKVEQFLPHVEGECNRMTRLINDMLVLASADAMTWKLKKEPLDMETLLIECYDMLCSCMNTKKQEIALELPEEQLPRINGDRERILQVITILADNAISYSPEGATILLRAFVQKHYFVIEVEDHGCGISDESKKHVFERFYRGDQSRMEKKHFGLGLSIARELVELHQGEINVKDTPGGGATFVIRLPI